MPTRFEELQEELRKRNAERPESPLESYFIDLLHRCDIYDFVTEFQVGTKFVDIAFVEAKLAVELDGLTFHWNRVPEDNAKDKYLEERGWRVIRIASYEKKIPYVVQIWNHVHPGEYLPYWLRETAKLDARYGLPEANFRRVEACPFCIVCGRGHDVDESGMTCVQSWTAASFERAIPPPAA